MGIIKRGILGGFSKKVANVVGGSWKGIAYMRSLPLSVANPNTPAQQAQRGAFSQTVFFAQQILGSVLQPFWNRIAQGQSGYNLFVSRNIAEFDANGLNTPAQLLTTIGPVIPATISIVDASASGNQAVVEWNDNTGTGNAQATDEAIIVIQNVTSGAIVTSVGGAPRSSGVKVITPFQCNSGDMLNVWLSFSKPDGTAGSPNYQLFQANP